MIDNNIDFREVVRLVWMTTSADDQMLEAGTGNRVDSNVLASVNLETGGGCVLNGSSRNRLLRLKKAIGDSKSTLFRNNKFMIDKMFFETLHKIYIHLFLYMYITNFETFLLSINFLFLNRAYIS